MFGCQPLNLLLATLSPTSADRGMAEVFQVIQMENKGLLLLGAIHGEDDVWAALLIAKHLSWPVVVVILSDSFKDWMQADVIIQERDYMNSLTFLVKKPFS
nr:protein PHYLLO, chloroplastic isoform X2 [Ipomoea batatas]